MLSRFVEIFYIDIYEHNQRKLCFQRLGWLDVWIFTISFLSSAIYIGQTQVDLSLRYDDFDDIELGNNIKIIFRIVSLALNSVMVPLIYQRYKINLELQKWKNMVDHQVLLQHHPSFYRMLVEQILTILQMPPGLDYSFSYMYIDHKESYSLDSLFSIVSLVKTNYFFIRALFENSIFNDHYAYETWQLCLIDQSFISLSVKCTTDQNTFTIKAENKDKHFYMLLPALFLMILVLGYALRECEIGVEDQDTVWFNYAYNIWCQAATLTTVGYGDSSPITLFGRIFVLICCCFGPAIISFMIISLVNFSQFTNSENVMYEAITLGEKNIEMKKSAVHAIYYSRHYYKFKNPDFRAFNNFMASLNNFKEIKKDIANQKKYPPIENFVINFTQSADQTIQSIYHYMCFFSIYLSLMSKIELLQFQIDDKATKLKKNIKEKQQELILNQSQSQINSLNNSQLFNNFDMLKPLLPNELIEQLKQEMGSTFEQFNYNLKQVKEMKQIQPNKKMNNKSMLTSKIGSKDQGYNLINCRLQASNQTIIETSIRKSNNNYTHNETTFEKEKEEQEEKLIPKILETEQPRQKTVQFLDRKQPQPSQLMNTIKDKLNFVLQDTFDSYEIIEKYIQRYYAIKQMSVVQVAVEENEVEQGFLQQQVNIISKLQIFKRNFIFNLVDIENENVQKSISQQIRNGNLIKGAFLSQNKFGCYYQNNQIQMFENGYLLQTLKFEDSINYIYLLNNLVIGQVQNKRNELIIHNDEQKYKIKFQQKEESEISKMIQNKDQIGIIDKDGCYYTSNSQMILKIQNSYVNVLNPSLYFLSFKIRNVCCGQGFILFLTIYGKLYSQGQNDKGQLGLIDQSYRNQCVLVNQLARYKISQVAAGVHHVLALSLKGELFGWGDGTDGQILPGKKIVCGSKILQIDIKESILQIQCGNYSSSYLNEQFEIIKWGRHEKKMKQMKDLIYLHHKIEWNMEYEILFINGFRLPKQITSNLQNIKKRLLKMSKKMAIDFSNELDNYELQEIQRICIDCEQDQNYYNKSKLQ